jgi:hypothetical protein
MAEEAPPEDGVPPGAGLNRVLVVGPEPPPMMGPAVCTQMLCAALEHLGVDVVRVNTQDNRSVFNTNVLDLRNLVLALKHAAQMAYNARRRLSFVYLPISQGRWGYARDALLMLIARGLRRRIVVHLHGASFQRFFAESTSAERIVIRRTLGWAECAIALTPGLSSVYDGLVLPERVRVLENGIPDPWPGGVTDLLVARRERAHRDPGPLHILFVGNHWLQKGADTLVRALAQPGLERAHVRLV